MRNSQHNSEKSNGDYGIDWTLHLMTLFLGMNQLDANPGNPNSFPVVISGSERGYISTAPEGVSDFLLQSHADGEVIPDELEELARRAVDISAHFGHTILRPANRYYGVIDEYSTTAQVDVDDQKLKISMRGPAQASQFAPSSEASMTPAGMLVPEPYVDITFTNHAADDSITTHRFTFGRENTLRLERAVDDENYETKPLTLTEAAEYLGQHLPRVEHQQTGRAVLEGGTMRMPVHFIRDFCNSVRSDRGSLTSKGVLKAIAERRARTGYDATMYVPKPYFDARHREGELFSITHPQAMIPEDILENPDSLDRIMAIAARSDGDNSTAISAVRILAHGLPLGQGDIAILTTRDDQPPLPVTGQVTTTIFDKGVEYLLQEPAVIAAADKYKAVYNAAGIALPIDDPIRANPVRVALTAGITGMESSRGREEFDSFLRPWLHPAMNRVTRELDIAYESLVELGAALRSTVYSKENIRAVSGE